MPQLPKFYVGDKVRHKVMRLPGEVVRVGREEQGSPQEGMIRKVYWKGWDPFDPDRVDWTWDFALEAA